MVSAPADFACKKAARMPTYDAEGRYIDPYTDDSLQALQRISHQQKQVRQIPRSNSSARRQKFSLSSSPRLTPRQCTPSEDSSSLPSHICLPVLSSQSPSSRSRKASRKMLQRRHSRERSGDAGIYGSEAEFLVRNQHLFTKEDFEAVLAAMAEDCRMEEVFKRQQEEESIQLAQQLAVEDFHQRQSDPSSRAGCTSTNIIRTESDDLEALVVALQAELDETDRKRQGEEESYRLACLLISEEAKACGMLDTLDGSHTSSYEVVQCHACHLDIEREDMIRELSCGHCFHAFCINRWLLMDKKDCPYCRRPVLKA